MTDRIGQCGYAIKIEGWDTETLLIDVYYDGTLYEGGLAPLRWLLKIQNRAFANYEDRLGKHFVYDVFEPLWQWWMLSNGVSFLHSAAISVDGQGVVLTGWGGSGKTSATSSLIRQSGDVKFLSDDLTFVTDEGELYPYYKSSVIYAHNTAGEGVPEDIILDGFGDRLQWYLRKRQYGDKGVRRRIPPKKLFEEKVASQSPKDLWTAVYLLRENRDQLSHKPISAEELARRSTAVILDELDWLVEYSAAACSAGSTAISPQDVVENTEGVYNDCFKDVETILVQIPMHTGANELADYIESEILDI
ncbi:hypothetical protein [Haloarchaeobius sp. HRN-SO-5]|uniref:hypothetical protein n=1 Tax=Haloarchaeobius sp. HRN-SO-5 TaxID=3446118 RepID=UPI003EBE8B04